jgi:hypothetical protein
MAGMAGGGIRAAGEALAITVGGTVIMADIMPDAGGGTVAGMADGTVAGMAGGTVAGMAGGTVAGMAGGTVAGAAGKSRSRPLACAQMTTRSTSSRLISSRR